MALTKKPPGLDKFIEELRAAWAALPDIESRMRRSAELLEVLVKDETLREHSKSWPSTEGHKNLLFYEDPDYPFVIDGVVRTPGRQGGSTPTSTPGSRTASLTARKN